MAAKKKAAKKKPSTRRKVSETQEKRRPVNKGGRPRFKPTNEQRRLVETLVGYGLTYKEIATIVINPQTGKGISSNTLERHFRDELDAGGARVKAKVIESLFKKATGESPQAVTAAIWITKARYGWKGDHVTHEVQGAQGVLVAPATISPEEWIARAQERNKDKKPPTDD
jgi:hypothetical protein